MLRKVKTAGTAPNCCGTVAAPGSERGRLIVAGMAASAPAPRAGPGCLARGDGTGPPMASPAGKSPCGCVCAGMPSAGSGAETCGPVRLVDSGPAPATAVPACGPADASSAITPSAACVTAKVIGGNRAAMAAPLPSSEKSADTTVMSASGWSSGFGASAMGWSGDSRSNAVMSPSPSACAAEASGLAVSVDSTSDWAVSREGSDGRSDSARITCPNPPSSRLAGCGCGFAGAPAGGGREGNGTTCMAPATFCRSAAACRQLLTTCLPRIADSRRRDCNWRVR